MCFGLPVRGLETGRGNAIWDAMELAHEPEKHALDLIGGGHRFSTRQTRSFCAEIMLNQKARARWDSIESHRALTSQGKNL